MSTQQLVALVKYAAFGITEGDFMNDWLSHLPEWLSQVIIAVVNLS